MKLSDAIRIGATLHAQGFGTYLEIDNPDGSPCIDDGAAHEASIYHTCALGAAFEAITQLLPYEDLLRHYDREDARVQTLLDDDAWEDMDASTDAIWEVVARRVTYPRLKPVGLSLALHGLGASETLGG